MEPVKFDLIDAHYFYPEWGGGGLAGAGSGKLPLLITGRGTDLTLIPQSPHERARIQQAAGQASALITVCEDLKDRLIELGEPAPRIVTLRNGVLTSKRFFTGRSRRCARDDMGLSGFTLLSVGSLIPRKGHEPHHQGAGRTAGCTVFVDRGVRPHARRVGAGRRRKPA